MSESYTNMTLLQLAGALHEPMATVTTWAAQGMPECHARPGTYDFSTCLAWSIGHSLQVKIEPIFGSKLQLTTGQKVAAGWLFSPGVATQSRTHEIVLYLNDMERAGISAADAFAALHWAMAAFEQFGFYPGRKASGDGPGSNVIKLH